MSITLTTPVTVTATGGSVPSENNIQGSAVSLDMDWLANIGTIRFSIGSGAPSAFNIGVYDVPIILTVNMTTGAWSAVNSKTGVVVGSGTFSGAGFTNFQNQFKAIRNAAESFAANQFMPGVQVAWV